MRLWKKNLKNMFIYTDGINICEASADVASKVKLTYSFSEMESKLKFSDFMRASDCEILMEIVRSMSGGSEEYVVIKEDSLIVRDNPILAGKEVSKFAPGKIINVSLPKQTKEADGYLWTNVYYKGKKGNERGWVTERVLSGATRVATKSTTASSIAAPEATKSPAAPPKTQTDEASINGTNIISVKKLKYNYEWGEYFVIAKYLNLNIRSAPDASDKKNVIGNARSGQIINVNLAVQIKSGNHLWVMIDLKNEKDVKRDYGWVAKEGYNEKGEFEELIHKNEQIVTDFKDYPDKLYATIDIDKKSKKIETKKAILGGYGGGEVPRDNEGRYYVAVGPRILYKNYPDYGKVQAQCGGEFSGFSRYIKVELQYNKDEDPVIIPCIVKDIKAHTYTKYPDIYHSERDNSKNAEYPSSIKKGEMQTGIMYPKASNKLINNEKSVEEDNMDGSVIEFTGGYITKGTLMGYMGKDTKKCEDSKNGCRIDCENECIKKEEKTEEKCEMCMKECIENKGKCITNKDLGNIKILKITSNVSREGLFHEICGMGDKEAGCDCSE